MFDAEKLLGSLLADGLRYKRKRRKSNLKWQLGLGALGVALAAWEHVRKPDAPASPPPPDAPPPPPGAVISAASPPPPPPPPGASNHRATTAPLTDYDEHSTLLIRAMICAAHADGALDDREQARILERLALAGIDREERAFLVRELAAPPDPAALFASIQDPLLAEEIYVVSRRVIDDGSDAELRYLRRLADLLRLSAERTADLELLALGRAPPSAPPPSPSSLG